MVVVAAVVEGCGASEAQPGPVEDAPDVVYLVMPDLSDVVPDVAFAAVPELLVTSDGRVISAAPAELAIAGELLPDVWVQHITPRGMSVLSEAIASPVPPRSIAELQDLLGAELGAADSFLPDRYRFRAIAAGRAEDFGDSASPILEWPETASIALADATECTRLPELEVGEAFETAAEDSAFIDDGIVYGVVAAPDWPGAPC